MPFQLKNVYFQRIPNCEKGYTLLVVLGHAKIYTLLLILLNSSIPPCNFDGKLPHILVICCMCVELVLLLWLLVVTVVAALP